jgi:hypothetical protein
MTLTPSCGLLRKFGYLDAILEKNYGFLTDVLFDFFFNFRMFFILALMISQQFVGRFGCKIAKFKKFYDKVGLQIRNLLKKAGSNL